MFKSILPTRFLLAAMSFFLVAGHASAWEIKIERPEVSGPVMLVCLFPDDMISQLSTLTRNQVIGIRAAAVSGELRNSCDDVQIPVGSTSNHARWIQTEDGWWILVRTVKYPNDFLVVMADPMVAQYGSQPAEWRLRFVLGNTGIFERVN